MYPACQINEIAVEKARKKKDKKKKNGIRVSGSFFFGMSRPGLSFSREDACRSSALSFYEIIPGASSDG